MRTIAIHKSVFDAMVVHASGRLPLEACGYLAGSNGSVMEFVPLTNTDASNEHFSLDPAEQFDAVRQLRKKGFSVVALYHSHPETPARPSEEDIRLAYDPDISYVIVSLHGGDVVAKSFRIREGAVEEEKIAILFDKEDL